MKYKSHGKVQGSPVQLTDSALAQEAPDEGLKQDHLTTAYITEWGVELKGSKTTMTKAFCSLP